MTDLIATLVFVALWLYGITRGCGRMRGSSVLLLVVLALTAASVSWGAGMSLTVSPVALDLKGDPGTVMRGLVTVANSADEPGRFRAAAIDLTEAREADRMRLSVDPEFFSLPAHGKGFVEVTGTIPSDARSPKFGAVVVSIVPEFALSAGHTVSAVPGIMVRIFVRTGEERVAGRIREVFGRWQNGSAEMRLMFENTGTVYLRPLGHLIVLDAEGREVTSSEFPTLIVYPGMAKEFRSRKALPPGAYTLRAVFEYGGSRFSQGEVRLP